MLEEIVELINDENYNELKKFIKKNYNEIGSLIFAICVSAQELDKKLLNSYIAIINKNAPNSFLRTCTFI